MMSASECDMAHDSDIAAADTLATLHSPALPSPQPSMPSPGAPCVEGGDGWQRDGYGNKVCANCSTRRDRCKGKFYQSDTGKICHNCYNKCNRSPPTTPVLQSSQTPTPIRSHKKRPASDPGECTAATAATAAVSVTYCSEAHSAATHGGRRCVHY